MYNTAASCSLVYVNDLEFDFVYFCDVLRFMSINSVCPMSNHWINQGKRFKVKLKDKLKTDLDYAFLTVVLLQMILLLHKNHVKTCKQSTLNYFYQSKERRNTAGQIPLSSFQLVTTREAFFPLELCIGTKNCKVPVFNVKYF